MNDSSVTAVSANELNRSKPYMLFYYREDKDKVVKQHVNDTRGLDTSSRRVNAKPNDLQINCNQERTQRSAAKVHEGHQTGDHHSVHVNTQSIDDIFNTSIPSFLPKEVTAQLTENRCEQTLQHHVEPVHESDEMVIEDSVHCDQTVFANPHFLKTLRKFRNRKLKKLQRLAVVMQHQSVCVPISLSFLNNNKCQNTQSKSHYSSNDFAQVVSSDCRKRRVYATGEIQLLWLENSDQG